MDFLLLFAAGIGLSSFIICDGSDDSTSYRATHLPMQAKTKPVRGLT